MREQVYYEDVRQGMHDLILSKHPTTRQLAMWAAGSGDFYEVHYDKDFAQSQGFEKVLVHGPLKAAFMAQLLTDWAGVDGWLRTLTCRYVEKDYAGDDLTVMARMIGTNGGEDEHVVMFEVWTENPAGGKTTHGSASVALPSRADRGATREVAQRGVRILPEQGNRVGDTPHRNRGEPTLDSLRQQIGIEAPSISLQIDKTLIRNLAQAVGDKNPLWRDEAYARKTTYGTILAPPYLLCTVFAYACPDPRPEQVPLRVPQVQLPLRHVLDGGEEWEFRMPMKHGDTLTCSSRLADVFERRGKLGRMLFFVFETTYVNHADALVGKCRATMVNY
jgi:acyl dehydratase